MSADLPPAVASRESSIEGSRRHWARLMAALVALVVVGSSIVASPAGAAERSRKVSGWFGYWTAPETMIDIARSSGKVLGEVNIFWWSYQGSANPVCTTTLSCPSPSATPWASAALLKSARGLQEQGIDVYATHTDLDGDRAGSLSSYLAKKRNRIAMANKLTAWVVSSGVDGVDLDWENFAFNDGSSSWATTRPRLTNMIRTLSNKLHAVGKKLSVTVPGGYRPFLDNGKPNPGGGYSVYNWKRLAPKVDRLRLMTYDYSWNRPGPIGPHKWAREVVRSAGAQVGPGNASKVYVGLHQYGKAWYDRDATDDYITAGDCPDSWTPSGRDAIGLSLVDARAVLSSYGVAAQFDKSSREWFATYLKSESGSYTNAKGKRRTRTCEVQKKIWFGAKETGVGRMRIVKRFGIGGVAIWQLASLDTGFFPAVRPYSRARKS